jgi:hypothetical protein
MFQWVCDYYHTVLFHALVLLCKAFRPYVTILMYVVCHKLFPSVGKR